MKLTLNEQTIILPTSYFSLKNIRLNQIVFDTPQAAYLQVRCPPITDKLSREICDVIAIATNGQYQNTLGDWLRLPMNTLLDRYFYLEVTDNTGAKYNGKYTAIFDFE